MTDKQFANGIYPNRLSDKAPDFVLASVSINVTQFLEWLQANKHLANERGYINLKGLENREKTKRYFEIDLWEPKKDVATNTGNVATTAPVKTEVYPEEEINPNDIPF